MYSHIYLQRVFPIKKFLEGFLSIFMHNKVFIDFKIGVYMIYIHDVIINIKENQLVIFNRIIKINIQIQPEQRTSFSNFVP